MALVQAPHCQVHLPWWMQGHQRAATASNPTTQHPRHHHQHHPKPPTPTAAAEAAATLHIMVAAVVVVLDMGLVLGLRPPLLPGSNQQLQHAQL